MSVLYFRSPSVAYLGILIQALAFRLKAEAAGELLICAGNPLLGVDLFLKVVAAVSILVMSFALVGLATGLGARYPRFSADNPSQVAGSYGGIAFMVMAALFVLVVVALVGWASFVYLFYKVRRREWVLQGSTGFYEVLPGSQSQNEPRRTSWNPVEP